MSLLVLNLGMVCYNQNMNISNHDVYLLWSCDCLFVWPHTSAGHFLIAVIACMPSSSLKYWTCSFVESFLVSTESIEGDQAWFVREFCHILPPLVLSGWQSPGGRIGGGRSREFCHPPYLHSNHSSRQKIKSIICASATFLTPLLRKEISRIPMILFLADTD